MVDALRLSSHNYPHIPVCRAEHRSIYREQPVRGVARMPCFAGGIGNPFQQTPIKPSERRKQATSGGFLLDTFLWQKIAPAFSAFATSMWLSEQRKVSCLPVRELALKQSSR
jgi:hypothetical protein